MVLGAAVFRHPRTTTSAAARHPAARALPQHPVLRTRPLLSLLPAPRHLSAATRRRTPPGARPAQSSPVPAREHRYHRRTVRGAQRRRQHARAGPSALACAGRARGQAKRGCSAAPRACERPARPLPAHSPRRATLNRSPPAEDAAPPRPARTHLVLRLLARHDARAALRGGSSQEPYASPPHQNHEHFFFGRRRPNPPRSKANSVTASKWTGDAV